MKRKIIKFSIKALISLGFIIWIIFKTNWPEVLFYLKKIQWWQIVFYLIILVFGMVISAYKWKILSEFKGLKFPLKKFFDLYLAGTFINNFMPSFVAGDAYKAYEISKDSKKYMEGASSVLVDRLTGLVGAMILALVFSAINYKVLLQNDLLKVVDMLIIISLCTDVAITQLKKMPRARQFVTRVLPEKAVDFLQQIYRYSNDTNIIKKAVLWGIIFSAVGVAFLNYILFWGLGIQISLIDYLSVIFIISIVSAIPITVNNIGLKEWAYITFFGLFGVGSGAVVAISVISRFLQMLVSFWALPTYLRSRR